MNSKKKLSKMAFPSLFNLSLLNLSVTDTLRVCGSSYVLPECGENVWSRKAESNLNIPPEFFNLYLGSPLSTPRPISESYRYLELASINNFLPETAVSRDVKTGQISGLFESFNGVREAILRGDQQQFEFFFQRLKPEAIKRLNFIFDFLPLISDFFPQGPNQVSFELYVTFCQRLGVWNSKEGKVFSDAQYWIIRDTPGNSIEERFEIRVSFNARIADPSILTRYSTGAILLLIEKGQEAGLIFFLNAFKRGEFRQMVREVFIAVLRSGNFDFFDSFSPYFSEIGLGVMSNPYLPDDYFIAAAYGGNPAIINFLLQIKGGTLKTAKWENKYRFIDSFVEAALRGFFTHRDVLRLYNILQTSNFNYYLSKDHLASIPIDILDLIQCDIVQNGGGHSNYGITSFLVQALSANLGQLNVVFYCLNQLEKYAHDEDFYTYFDSRLDPHTISLSKDLTPLSVRIVEATVNKWKSRPALPPLV